ncbi:hypothetical protein B0H19DRAFT_1201881 [Mycena capillaripes]|nr:hypothetical protein B0H19DRAFT_1201881 [Mycena capillaripes]
MSVEELHARIAKFSADIDLQKEVLKQLERSKSAAQRQLNALRDPMARLPLEISSEIFLQCLSESRPDAGDAPLLLLNVCNSWTDIAVSIPALWASIHLEFPGVEVLEIWLRRARNYPLSVSLRQGLDSDTAIVLGQYAKELKHLQIYDGELRVDVDTLGKFEPFRSLEALTLGGLYVEEDECFEVFTLPTIVGLLGLAPNLVECTFDRVRLRWSDAPHEPLVLPQLRSLKFEGSLSFDHDNETHILEHLVLPVLKTLSLLVNTISSTDFSLFLKRSSPPLRQLTLKGRNDFSFTELTNGSVLCLPSRISRCARTR